MPLRCVAQTQRRYAVRRPLGLLAERPAPHRAQETGPPPETVRPRPRRCRPPGRLGLLPGDLDVRRQARPGPPPDDVRQEMDRLKALDRGCHYRELARMICCQCAYPRAANTAKRLGQPSPGPTHQPLARWPSHPHPDRDQARRQGIKRDEQGWDTLRISRFVQVSRPTVSPWMARFAAAHGPGLMDTRRGPKGPPRQGWCPRRGPVYHLHKGHPAAGEVRLWRLLAPPDISVRTGGRVRALHKRVYDAIPLVPTPGPKSLPHPHPSKAPYRHASWCSAGRQRDLALDGVQGWRILMLAGYCRPSLAGALAPTEATWAALMVRSTAGLRDGAPTCLGAESGGASTSDAFAAGCRRLEIDHKTSGSTPGQRSLHWSATPCDLQRRL